MQLRGDRPRSLRRPLGALRQKTASRRAFGNTNPKFIDGVCSTSEVRPKLLKPLYPAGVFRRQAASEFSQRRGAIGNRSGSDYRPDPRLLRNAPLPPIEQRQVPLRRDRSFIGRGNQDEGRLPAGSDGAIYRLCASASVI